jgi:6-phosphogluconolactonase
MLLVVAVVGEAAGAGGGHFVYIGTYTGAKSKGIYLSRLDPASGTLAKPALAAEAVNPTFLALHPNGGVLYAANEIGNFGGKKAGAVGAFRIDRASGALTLLNQAASVGAGPCHVVVDATGKTVLVANYGGGSVAALPIRADGSLGEATAFVQHQGSSVDPRRQEGPHAHCVNLDAANRFAFVTDLGLDKVLIYRLDPAQGALVANDPPSASVKPGAGPRHLAFHPAGRFAYVINEMGSTLTAFAYDAARGALRELETVSTLPTGFTGGNSTAEVVAHPSGKFLYGSNRGHNSIAVYAIDAAQGKLTLVEHQSTRGRTPRNFAIDPTGRWLLAANQDTDNIVLFRIDAQSGRLAATEQVIEVGAPVCIQFLAAR